jgi:hypothetical protein
MHVCDILLSHASTVLRDRLCDCHKDWLDGVQCAIACAEGDLPVLAVLAATLDSVVDSHLGHELAVNHCMFHPPCASMGYCAGGRSCLIS